MLIQLLLALLVCIEHLLELIHLLLLNILRFQLFGQGHNHCLKTLNLKLMLRLDQLVLLDSIQCHRCFL